MNEYSNELNILFEIEKSKDNFLKFNIIIKKDEEKEDKGNFDKKDLIKYLALGNDEKIQKDLKIKVELIKINNGYLLIFNKIKGSLSDYYQVLKKLMIYAEDFI